MLTISIAKQQARLFEGEQCVFEAPVSTALKGPGEQKGSEQTPRGLHQIRACIGDGQAENTVFIGRRPTGEIFEPWMLQQQPDRDWILTRILWLSGLELGRNRLANVDTMQRYIYIHGCPDSFPMGKPLSHGCIRMHNKDLLILFDLVQFGLKVLITE